LDQFIILLLGSFAVTLCLIFAMEPRSRRISLPAGVGILATVVGAGVGAYYTFMQLERWNTEDRPRVVASGAGCSVDNKCGLEVINTGTEDATSVEVKVASTTDLLHTHHTLLTQDDYKITRIRRGFHEQVTTQIANDAGFLVVCIKYRNDQGTPFANDHPKFYAIGTFYQPPGPPGRRISAVMAASEDAKLLEGFSCAELEPRATKQPRR
jgi:hypothetical protein